MSKYAIEIVGWSGTILILLAYLLVSFSIITSDSLLYQSLNLGGAAGIALISLVKKAYPPAVLNIIWALIALIAVLRMLSS